jgi:hypothetical protein
MFCVLLFFPMVLLSRAFFFEAHSSSRIITARAHSRVEFLEILIRAFLTIVFLVL